MKTQTVVSVIAAMAIAVPAEAQYRGQWGVYADVGYAHIDSIGGVSAALGAAWIPGNVYLALSADLLFWFKEPDPRYYRDTFSNGQSRCRDSFNGQFASNSFCAKESLTSTALSGEIGARLSERSPVVFGGGYRLGGNSAAFGFLGYSRIDPGQPAWWHARVLAGPGYLAVRLGAVLGQRVQ